MSPEAFLAVLLSADNQGSQFIGPRQIAVNLDATPPPEFGIGVTQPGDLYVLNIAVNTQGFVDGQNTFLDEILQQVETIRFTFQNNEYELEVVSATFHTNAGTGFYFYTVQPFLIPAAIANNIQSAPGQSPWPTGYAYQEDTIIDFTPFLTYLQGLLDTYNVLYNNASAARQSYKIRQSQRIQSTNVPTNFEPIYSGSAELANIQDSMYYDTGWTNGRYKGTLSTAKNYAGVPPSLLGKAFTGEAYSDVVEEDYICAVPYDIRVYEEFFHTGPAIYPRCVSGSIGIEVPTLQTSTDPTVTYNGRLTGSLDVGDIIRINTEKMRVLDHTPVPSDPALSPFITVERAYAGTTAANHSGGSEIHKIERVDLFRFSDTNAQITQADNAKVFVRETGDVLSTDIFGVVHSVITCSISFVSIDDPN